MRLGIDIDGCLANFGSTFGDALIQATGENKLPVDFKSNPDWPPTWNWHYDAGYTREQVGKVWKDIVEGRGFWSNLESLPGANETIRCLNRLTRSGHDVYFLTHRSGVQAKQQTEMWLEERGMERPTVLLVGDKLPVISALGIDFFIDDKIETVNVVHNHFNFYRDRNRTLVPLAERKPIFLKDAPYNRVDRLEGLQVASSVEDALRQAGLWQDPKRGRPKVAA